MGRTRLAETYIQELKQRIKISNERKAELTKYLHDLWNSYQKGLISRDFYVETAHRHFEGKTLKEWISFYEHYIKECKRLIKKHQKGVIKNAFFILLFSSVLLFLIGFIISNTQLQSTLTGFLVQEPEITKPQVTEIDFTKIETTTEETIPETNARVTTSQYQAVLGQPVQWKKQISLETIEETKIKLPRETLKVSVNKFIKSYSEEQEEALQERTSPSQEEPSSSETIFRLTGQIIGTESETETREKQKANFKITGGVIGAEKEFIIFRFFKNIFGAITGRAISEETDEEVEITIEDDATEYEIEYETPAPYAIEEDIERGKRIQIIGPETAHYENVLAFTDLPESLNIKNPNSVKIHWLEQNTFVPVQNIKDKDNNGIYDYVEFIAPSLSSQTFEIIIITKAEHLDSSREFISDIYEEVKALDDLWSETIPSEDYVRVTFEIPLTSSKDITIYLRTTSGTPKIEVYENNESVLIAEFTTINDNEYNKVYLTNLTGNQDTFDLRILDGSIEIDHIIDPPTQVCYMPYGTNVLVQPTLMNSSYVDANRASTVKYDMKHVDGSGQPDPGVLWSGGSVSTVNTSFHLAPYAEDTIITGIDGKVLMEIFCKVKEVPDGTLNVSLYEVDSSNSIVYTFFELVGTPCNAAESFNYLNVTISQRTVSAGNHIRWDLIADKRDAEIDWEIKSKFGEYKGGGGGTAPTAFTTAYCDGFPTNSDNKNWEAIAFNEEVSAGGDTTDPTVALNSPADNANLSSSSVTLNCTAYDNINVTNVTLYGNWSGGWHLNQTNSTPYNNTPTIFSKSIDDGIYVWNCEACDNSSNCDFASSNRTFTVDATNPTSTITQPTNASTTYDNTPDINITLTDNMGDPINYTFYLNDSANKTGTVANNTPTNITMDTLPYGLWLIKVEATDNMSNSVNSSTLYLTVAPDSTAPDLTINAPTGTVADNTPTLNITLDETVDTLWYNIDDGANTTICTSCTGEQTKYLLHEEGTYTVYAFANDSSNNVNNTESSEFTVDMNYNYYDTFDDNSSIETYNGVNWTTGEVNFTGSGGGGGSVGWWNTSWEKRKEINITNGNGNLTAFPAYVNVSKESEMQADWDDLRFINGSCTSSETSVLAYEIENYTGVDADIWVRIPNLVNGITPICMYYNNSGASSGQNVTGVWDDNYIIIQHLQEAPANDVKGFLDSTDNDNDFTPNTLAEGASGAAGIIAGGVLLDGSSADYLHESTESNIGTPGDYTVSAWLQPTALGTYDCVFSVNTYDPALYIYNGGPYIYDSSGIASSGSEDLTTDGTWYHVTWMRNATESYSYVSGVSDGTYSYAGTWQLGTVYIGWSTDGTELFPGYIDEVRYSNIARSQDWINQSYQIVENQGSLVDTSGKETYSAGGGAGSGNFTIYAINTSANITSVTNVTWSESNTDANNNITVKVSADSGSNWYDATSGSALGETFTGANNSLIYRVFFTTNQSQTISLLDMNISWSAEAGANQAPTIPFVQLISAQNPVESSTKSITFNFTATDTNGASDIDTSTAEAYFQKSGETTRSNTSCVNWASAGNDVNFTCTIDMWYFDDNGDWTINVTIQDDSAEYAENSSTTFTYNLLTAMVISPTALNWPEINLPDTDIGATNDPITLNNTGNAEPMNINITAYNLRGETTITQYIYANNFTIENASPGCSGTAMQNATSINVTSAILQKGNNSLNYNNATSGQEQIFFCLKGVPQDISAQSYSSSAYGAWEIKILLVAIIPAGRRRKKKLKKSNKILKLLIKLTDELRKEYSKEKETIINQLIRAVQKEYGVKRKEVLDLIREKEIKIPILVFSKELGALESLVKYMKENLNLNYKEISEKLLRNERTIWTAYKKATEKQPKPMKIKKIKLVIPLSIFKNKELTILESIILYLKKKEMKFSEIAKLLERDQRNIWTIYSRAIKKTN